MPISIGPCTFRISPSSRISGSIVRIISNDFFFFQPHIYPGGVVLSHDLSHEGLKEETASTLGFLFGGLYHLRRPPRRFCAEILGGALRTIYLSALGVGGGLNGAEIDERQEVVALACAKGSYTKQNRYFRAVIASAPPQNI